MSHLLGRLASFLVGSISNLSVLKSCPIVKVGFFCGDICLLLGLIPILHSLLHLSQKKLVKCVKILLELK